MKIYLWRHNKKFHSYSMINEPCVNSHFYQDAVAIVLANSKEEAIEQLMKLNEGWQGEDLAQLEALVYDASEAKVLFSMIG